MKLGKLRAWFVSEAGRKFSYYTAGTVLSGVLFGTFLPQSLFLNQYQDFVRLYNKGLSVPLPKKLEDRFEKALELLEIEPYIKTLYKPFYVYGFDVFSAGSSYSKFGCIVGLPINFSYDGPNEVEKYKVQVAQNSIVWETEEGKQLQDSLVLSENAQLYAMAREIKYRQTPKPIMDCFFTMTSGLMVYSISRQINEKFNYYVKPFGFRVVLYSFVGLFAYGVYAMSKDLTQMYYEEKIDKELVETNAIFAEGGREFYEKLLERNKALRKLLGPEGESLYSILGNDNYFLRTKHLPNVQRKCFFDDKILNQ